MKRPPLAVLALSLVVALPVAAREEAGVTLPDTTVVEGKSLTLNGMGVRKRAIFKVYVAGLYLEKPSQDAAEVVRSDQVKRVQMHMLRDLDRGKIVDAIREGFEKNARTLMPKLQERLDKFSAAIPDLKKGDQLVLTYVPGKGTEVKARSGGEISVEGKDFADALFAVWLGREPVDGGLKKDLLGAK
jgi:hypothetical protein